jgi:arylsulfatase A-like enzyme
VNDESFDIDEFAFKEDEITFAVSLGPRKPRQGKPNVVVFFTDQQRWDTTGAHGNPLGLTPNFDRAARSGTHVENSFTVQPVCGPARACMQTGMYATQTGCYRNGIPLPEDAPALAEQFSEAGYRTGYIGKWHLAGHEPVPERERGGYEHWLASNKLEFTSDAYHTVVFDNDKRPVRLPGYRVDALTDAAIRFIDENQEEPFFLFLSHLEPHHQNHVDDYPPPNGYREPYAGRWVPPDLAALGGSTQQHIAGYYGMVKRLDEAYGRLLDTLESLGLRENTVVLFTSDHGNHFKTRNGEYKRSGHDSSLRVPTVFTGPGFDGGRRMTELVSILDLSATLLDAAGIPVPESFEGRSVLPLVRGNGPEWRNELFFQVSESEVGRGIRTPRWKYGVSAPGANPWSDAHAERYVESYLYDLWTDPYELFNLAGHASHQRLSEHLRERLLTRMNEVGEPRAVIEPASPKPRYEQRQLLEGEEFR